VGGGVRCVCWLRTSGHRGVHNKYADPARSLRQSVHKQHANRCGGAAAMKRNTK
jgi:hypothetical protein